MRGKRIISITICAALAFSMVGCNSDTNVKKSSDYGTIQKTNTDEEWKQITSGKVQVGSKDIQMNMDVKTGHFTIQDMKKNVSYNSAVINDLKGALIDADDRSKSEILAYYYDEKGQKQELSSYGNSVVYKNVKVTKKDNAVRVTYTLQLEETPPFVPQFLTEDMFKTISDNVDSTTFFKIKLMYKYFSKDKDTVDSNKMKSKYPYLKENNAYIIKENLSDTDRKSIGKYIAEAKFDETEYYNKLKELDIELSDENIPLQIILPIEYSINEEGFSAKVLSDLITTTDDDYKIQSVAVLPFFNCGVVSEQDGFWILPDGSGSVMKINKKDNRGYSQRVYGRDMTCTTQKTTIIEKNTMMPMIAFSSSQGSWLARIDSSAETATVYAYRAGSTEYTTHGYMEFDIYTVDSLKVRKSAIEQAAFSKSMCSEQPGITYKLLDKKASIYSLASTYQNILKEEKLISKKETNNNIYLDFVGYVTEEASFMGVSYEKKVVLSTIKGIKKAVKQLTDDGIDNIYVRLYGYSDGGQYHGLVDGFSLDKGIGTIDELKELSTILEKTGGALYLEDDFYEVYRDGAFDGFTSSSDVIRAVDKTLVDVKDNNIVSDSDTKGENVRYIIAPKLYKSLADSFVSQLNKKVGDNIRISIGNAGKYLVSDLNEADEYDRVQTKNATLDAVDSALANGEFMTNVGNEYILSKTSHILNMPLSDSAFNAENYHIPFYQMVLKGHCNYAGEALNTADNIKKNKIWTLLSGANQYYSCVTEEENLYELKGEQKVYPSLFSSIYEEIKEFNSNNKELYNLVHANEITGFDVIKDGLYRITYDKVAVLFNETDELIKWNGKSIEANNYMIVGK